MIFLNGFRAALHFAKRKLEKFLTRECISQVSHSFSIFGMLAMRGYPKAQLSRRGHPRCGQDRRKQSPWKLHYASSKALVIFQTMCTGLYQKINKNFQKYWRFE